MSVLIELRMASFGNGPGLPPLSPQGTMLAERVGERQIRFMAFTHAVSTHSTACSQTLKAMLRGAQITSLPQPLYFPIGSIQLPLPESLHRACQEADNKKRRGWRFATCLSGAPEDTRRFAKALSHIVIAHNHISEPTDRLLVVTCSPYLELILYGLSGTPPERAFKPCTGVRLAIEDDHVRYTVMLDSH